VDWEGGRFPEGSRLLLLASRRVEVKAVSRLTRRCGLGALRWPRDLGAPRWLARGPSPYAARPCPT